MSKKFFTKKEVELLTSNPYVKKVSTKGITYTEEFKQVFISQYDKGKFPREIFESCGFDVEIIGIERIKSASRRWRDAFRESGVGGLTDTRTLSSGRPRKKELTTDDKNARLEAENNLLKAEIELLKKIRFAERGLKKNDCP